MNQQVRICSEHIDVAANNDVGRRCELQFRVGGQRRQCSGQQQAVLAVTEQWMVRIRVSQTAEVISVIKLRRPGIQFHPIRSGYRSTNKQFMRRVQDRIRTDAGLNGDRGPVHIVKACAGRDRSARIDRQQQSCIQRQHVVAVASGNDAALENSQLRVGRKQRLSPRATHLNCTGNLNGLIGVNINDTIRIQSRDATTNVRLHADEFSGQREVRPRTVGMHYINFHTILPDDPAAMLQLLIQFNEHGPAGQTGVIRSELVVQIL